MKNFYEANKKDIKKVKGIGEVLAKELIEKKEEIIDYYDLQAIKGVGKKVYQNFKKKFYIIREDYGCGACPYVKIEKPEIKCLEKDSSYDLTVRTEIEDEGTPLPGVSIIATGSEIAEITGSTDSNGELQLSELKGKVNIAGAAVEYEGITYSFLAQEVNSSMAGKTV